jgi:hypothetical protein
MARYTFVCRTATDYKPMAGPCRGHNMGDIPKGHCRTLCSGPQLARGNGSRLTMPPE